MSKGNIVIVFMLLSCLFSINIEAGWREIESNEPEVRRFVHTGGNLGDSIKEIYAAVYKKEPSIKKSKSQGSSVKIDNEVSCNDGIVKFSTYISQVQCSSGEAGSPIKVDERMGNLIKVLMDHYDYYRIVEEIIGALENAKVDQECAKATQLAKILYINGVEILVRVDIKR